MHPEVAVNTMPKIVLKASLSITRLHLHACFSRLAMDQSFLTHLQLSVHLDILLQANLTGRKGRRGK